MHQGQIVSVMRTEEIAEEENKLCLGLAIKDMADTHVAVC